MILIYSTLNIWNVGPQFIYISILRTDGALFDYWFNHVALIGDNQEI